MTPHRWRTLALSAVLAWPQAACGQPADSASRRAPQREAQRPAVPGVATQHVAPSAVNVPASALKARVYAFADDSMQGRAAGTPGHERAVAYLVRELTRLGVRPAGESGTYLQRVPVRVRGRDTTWSSNVLALVEGSDTVLRAQYVALGAHSDHLGVRPAARGQRDSVFNGADDDASGSMALLELAAHFQASARPRRSLLFVWHTGEELDLDGSRWFVEHPTVPLDRIVTQVNVDMIGRGGAADMPRGSDNYLSVIGPRRLSSELARWVNETNAARATPMALDYTYDTDGHPENIYCRSDHANYASRGIPIVFFFTGLHGDYHQVSDEPQRIDYAHYARITGFIGDLVVKIAEHATAPAIDGPKPAADAPCRQ